MHFREAYPMRHWYRFTRLTILLLPFSALFGLAVLLRRALYRSGVLRVERLPVPILIIGNLTVGGTGKTPLVLWTAECLRASGRRPGIILRGYGGTSTAPRAISPNDDAHVAGDEALLLARRSRCPVWTARNRAAAGRALLQAHPECDVIISDDGLQHYRLARDIEIAVEDERGHGNGFLLPAGPLREPASRLVDATVVNSRGHGGSRPGTGPLFHMQLQAAGFENLHGHPVDIEHLRGKRLHALAGIGNPHRFFDLLHSLGLEFVPHPFRDHHAFTATDLHFPDSDAVLMTEKDAVKCGALIDDSLRDKYVMLRVAASLDPAYADFLLKALNGRQTA